MGKPHIVTNKQSVKGSRPNVVRKQQKLLALLGRVQEPGEHTSPVSVRVQGTETQPKCFHFPKWQTPILSGLSAEAGMMVLKLP